MVSGTVGEAQGKPAASALVLHFPDDQSLGVVHIRPAGLHAYDSFENVYLGWELLGDARGELHVPPGMESRLTVANGAVEAITPLTQIPDGIDRLGFWKTRAKDEALQAIIHLKSLKDLSARGTQITDAGLRYIRAIRPGVSETASRPHPHRASRLSLSAFPERLAEDQLKHLAEMRDLESLDVGDIKVTDRGRSKPAEAARATWRATQMLYIQRSIFFSSTCRGTQPDSNTSL